MKITETVLARGHENILAKHRTAFEITKEAQLSKKGDCILAVSADKALTDLGIGFKENLRKEGARVIISIEAGEVAETVSAFGSPSLILAHPVDMVVRKSSYICDRTLAIRADKAAHDLSEELVAKLKNPEQRVKITITVEV